jgi:hypothetical protein
MADKPIAYSDTAVALLKANLGYYGEIPEEVEQYLTQLLTYSAKRLAQTAGIHLAPGDLYDDQLQVMYAAWLYRKGGEGAEKPPMLKEAIRDYQVGKAMSEAAV